METTDEWNYSRVGILERHVAEKGMATSDMAVEAAKRCLDSRGIVATDVEAIVVATVTPDMLFPATACLAALASGVEGEPIRKKTYRPESQGAGRFTPAV